MIQYSSSGFSTMRDNCYQHSDDRNSICISAKCKKCLAKCNLQCYLLFKIKVRSLDSLTTCLDMMLLISEINPDAVGGLLRLTGEELPIDEEQASSTGAAFREGEMAEASN